MTIDTEYVFKNVQHARVNGRDRKLFDAFEERPGCIVFVGRYSVTPKASHAQMVAHVHDCRFGSESWHDR